MNSYIPDLNVRVALSYDEHVHHSSALQWFDGIGAGVAYFCRFTQLAFLRLLTHPSVMRDAVRTQRQAWGAYDALIRDDRVMFLGDPDTSHVEPLFRKMTSGDRPLSKQWPDAYLVAFALAAELSLVTFDRGLRNLAHSDILVLK